MKNETILTNRDLQSLKTFLLEPAYIGYDHFPELFITFLLFMVVFSAILISAYLISISFCSKIRKISFGKQVEYADRYLSSIHAIAGTTIGIVAIFFSW